MIALTASIADSARMAQKPPFLKDSTTSAAAPSDPFPNRPQKQGGMEKGDPSDTTDRFPNRPQKQGGLDGDQKSIPEGGKGHPLGAPKNPSLPAKLGK